MAGNPLEISDISDDKLLAEFRRRFPAAQQAPYPRPIFDLLNDYRPAITIEAVIYRPRGESYEVLLRDRGATEDYPLACHIVGSYMLQGEQAREALERIVANEVGPDVKIKSHVCAGVLFDRFEKRGPQVHIIFALTIGGEPTEDSLHWEPVEQLSHVTNLLEYHRGIIEDIALPVITGAHQPAQLGELAS